MSLKLTIELVPELSWYTNVRSNTTQETWDRIRKKCYQDAHYKCEICGGVGPNHPVECHEIWDYDDANLIQKLVGFIALCPACHSVKHLGFTSTKGLSALEKAIEHLKKVNGWDNAHAYLVEVWNKWMERSCYLWEVDISYIEEYLND